MSQKSDKTFSVIGAGKVGKTLAWLIRQHTTLTIGTVINRTLSKANTSAEFIGAGSPGSYSKNLADACTDVILISTPDEQIIQTAHDIAKTGIVLNDKLFFHCSGSVASTALSVLEKKGATVASVHPLKSFASPDDAVKTFSGIYCAAEGDISAVDKLTQLFTQIGGIVFPVATESKVLYHSAAVITCNYLYALMDIGLNIYKHLDIPDETAIKIMTPLLRGTIDNAIQLGPKSALTGPIARGEQAVVKNHIARLQELNPLYAEVYAALGKVTADMAFDSRSISKETRDLLHSQFD